VVRLRGLIVAGLVLLLAAGSLYLFLSRWDFWGCENELVQAVDSPDGTLKAVIFQRDCGATTGYYRQVAMLKASQKFPRRVALRSFFALEGQPKIEAVWEGSRQIRIRYESGFNIVLKQAPEQQISATFETFR
jgi:hypothetical protein